MPTAQRIFTGTRLLLIGNTTAAEAAVMLASRMRAHFGSFSTVVGIAAGSRFPARVIASHLDLPCFDVIARHNRDDTAFQQATGAVTCDTTGLSQQLSHPLTGRVLLVDDICGSGATFATVITALKPLSAPGTTFCTASLCLNKGATRAPDAWVWTVNDWVVFGWETPPDLDLPRHALALPHRVQP